MKAIIVNDHLYADGGADVAALSSASALARAGVEVTLFVADRPRADDARTYPFRVVSTDQDDLARGHPLSAAWQGLWNRKAAADLRALLSSCRTDDTVVHVHSWTKALSSSVFTVAPALGFAQACTLHEYFSVCPTGMLFDSQRDRICQLKPMSTSCLMTHCDARRYTHKLYRAARHAVQERHGRLPDHVDRFITISQLSQQVLARHLPLDTAFSRVRNPIDVADRPPPANVAAQQDFVMIARMFAPKGWRLFLDACERARVRAQCVGDGPDRAALQARYPAAHFTGQLDRAGVVDALRSARALVLPSRWYETQGLVIAEAAAQGVPAIVSDVCGGAEAIEHGANGLTFANGDVDALASHLRCVADDDAEVARMGREAAARFWADPPTPPRHAAELMAVYGDMLARRQVAGHRQTPTPAHVAG